VTLKGLPTWPRPSKAPRASTATTVDLGAMHGLVIVQVERLRDLLQCWPQADAKTAIRAMLPKLHDGLQRLAGVAS
jgi:hypothetical protein